MTVLFPYFILSNGLEGLSGRKKWYAGLQKSWKGWKSIESDPNGTNLSLFNMVHLGGNRWKQNTLCLRKIDCCISLILWNCGCTWKSKWCS